MNRSTHTQHDFKMVKVYAGVYTINKSSYHCYDHVIIFLIIVCLFHTFVPHKCVILRVFGICATKCGTKVCLFWNDDIV